MKNSWINLLSALCAWVSTASAYDFIDSPAIKWRSGDIPMELQLDATLPPFLLQDGKSSWNAVAQEALDFWNAHLSRVRFATIPGSGRSDGNRQNEVFFSSNIYGQRFGDRVLAVTTVWHIGAQRIEGDTIFNTALEWDSYRGPLNYDVFDLRRVALHELGHTLGLDHPDAARQVEVAVMNSVISDQDDLAEDDIRGIHALYPADARFTLKVRVEPPAQGEVLFTPPPDEDGKYQAGTLVTLQARPARRHRFDFWAGDLIRTGRTLKVLVADDENLVAHFSTNSLPVILVQPRSQLVSDEDRVIFRVRASGRPPLTYQWQLNGTNLPGATASQLVIELAGHEDSGLYSCQVTNPRGGTPSKPARLVVDGY